MFTNTPSKLEWKEPHQNSDTGFTLTRTFIINPLYSCIQWSFSYRRLSVFFRDGEKIHQIVVTRMSQGYHPDLSWTLGLLNNHLSGAIGYVFIRYPSNSLIPLNIFLFYFSYLSCITGFAFSFFVQTYHFLTAVLLPKIVSFSISLHLLW